MATKTKARKAARKSAAHKSVATHKSAPAKAQVPKKKVEPHPKPAHAPAPAKAPIHRAAEEKPHPKPAADLANSCLVGNPDRAAEKTGTGSADNDDRWSGRS